MMVTALAQAATVIATFMLEDQLRVSIIVSVFTGMWLLSSLMFGKAAESASSAPRMA